MLMGICSTLWSESLPLFSYACARLASSYLICLVHNEVSHFVFPQIQVKDRMIFDFNKWRESISVLMVTDLNYFLLQNVHVWGFVQFFFFTSFFFANC